MKRSEKQIFTRAERFCNDVVAAQTKEKKTKETQDIICYDQSKTIEYRTGRKPLFWSIRMPELAWKKM